MSEPIYALVTVTLVEGAVVDPDDGWADGSDAIAGSYGFVLDPEKVSERISTDGEDNAVEYALDRFHEQIGISELDNYKIVAERISGTDDAPKNTSWR